jgi:hypothetical protein
MENVMNEVKILLNKLTIKSAELAEAKTKKMEFLHRISRPSITKEELERTISCEIGILAKVEALESDCNFISVSLDMLNSNLKK